MQCEDTISTRTALSYQTRYFHYYKFRLRVFICTSVCLAAVVLLVACFIIQVSNSTTLFPEEYELAEDDMRPIEVSTAFCEGITIKGAQQLRTLRILKEVKLSPYTRVSNVSVDVFVSRGKYWYKAFYLLKGSSIVVNARSDIFFKLFIFKRRSNLESWISKLNSTRHKRSSYTSNKATSISYVYKIPQTGNYYILFQRISGERLIETLSVVFTVHRRAYDVDTTIHECAAAVGQGCTARLMFNSDERALIEVKQSTAQMYLNNVPTVWHCKPRVWFFIVLFAGAFLLCLTVGLVIYVMLMNRKRAGFVKECRKHSSRSQSEGSATLLLTRGSMRSTHGSLRRQPSRAASVRSQGNESTTGMGTLQRDGQATRLPSIVTPIYTGDLPWEDEEDSVCNSPTTPRTSLSRAGSVETISLASLDFSRPRRASFSTFQHNAAGSDFSDTASLQSCPGAIIRRHSYRNPHHPGYYQELKREREVRDEFLRDLQRDRDAPDTSDAERESLLVQGEADAREERDILRERERDILRERKRELQRERKRDIQREREREIMRGSERDILCERERDILRERERDIPRDTRAFSLDRATASRLRDVLRDGLLDRRSATCPRHQSNSMRDFYRDLERERTRSQGESDRDNGNNHGSDYEREFEKALEDETAPYASHKRGKSKAAKNTSGVGREAAEKPAKLSRKPRSKQKANGFIPRMEPIWQQQLDAPVQVHTLPNGKAKGKHKAKKDVNDNQQEVKLRTLPNRKKDGFWRPRLSVVSEV